MKLNKALNIQKAKQLVIEIYMYTKNLVAFTCSKLCIYALKLTNK